MTKVESTSTTVLSDAKIRQIRRPDKGQIEIRDTIVPGLRVRIGVSGTKTFMLRKSVVGRYRNISLGRYSERFGIAEARKKARQILSDIEIKADPVAALPKPQKRTPSLTVAGMWPAYKLAKSDRRKIGEIERVFKRHILPAFGDRAADQIRRSEITRFIDEIAQTTPVMARNILAYFSSFYGWALPRLDNLEANPCRDAGRPPAPKPRDRVLSEAETGALWRVLDAERPPFGPAIKLLLLTGQRRNEVFDADRAEFDLDKKLWTIPGGRAKNGSTHLVPIPPLTSAIVKSLLAVERSDKLLPARGNWDASPSGFSKAMRRIRAALEVELGHEVAHWTLHDLRRTVATGLQRLGIRLEVTEAVLNHLSGSRSGIVGVYQRHNYFEEKRVALSTWERELKRLARRKAARKGRSHTGRAKAPQNAVRAAAAQPAPGALAKNRA